MKGWLKLLVLATVPILAATAVVDQGLAADKGSQLIFHTNMAHKNFISVANANDKAAVTVLVQYYNDEMKLVLWYLRVIPGDGNVLVDAYDHMIPGTETNVSSVIGGLPAMSTDEKAGMNSGRFVIAVTAVGANVMADLTTGDADDDTDNPTANLARTVNVLFPDFLAKDMHGTDNIDNCGGGPGGGIRLALPDPVTGVDNNLGYTKQGEDGADDCKDADVTSKNVGKLTVDNAVPVAFNHLTGHFTEALVSTAAGGADQTASWGGTPIVRPAVDDTANAMADGVIVDYLTLNGADGSTGSAGGRLAEKDAGGAEKISYNSATGYTTDGGNTITNTTGCTPTDATPTGCRENRGLNMGALVLPALHGGSEEETHQIALLLSVADDFGAGDNKAGKYKLITAKTGYKVTLMDNMGDALPDPKAESGPVYGGADAPDAPPGVSIIVEGIRVMTDADLAKCSGTMMDGYWNLSSLTSIVPTAASGTGDFAGLDAMLMGMENASPGWIKFKRMALTCKKDYGDGDSATGSTIEENDGVPTSDERTYTAGTVIVEEANQDRAFVTTGQALLKFLTADSTFAASWSLKSPPSPAN